MYNKTITSFSFCDIQNNQRLGRGYQPKPKANADNPYLDLNYSGFHKNLIQELLLNIFVKKFEYFPNQGANDSLMDCTLRILTSK